MFNTPRFTLWRKRRAAQDPSRGKRPQVAAVARLARAPSTRSVSKGAFLDLGSFRRDGILRTVLRFSNSVPCTSGGLVSTYWNPQLVVQSAAAFAAYAGLYDLYRVRMFRLKWTPSQVPTGTGYGVTGTTGCVDAPLYTFMDDDTGGATLAGLTQAQANAYGNIRTHSVMSSWERWFRLPIPSQSALGKPSGWLDCAVTGPSVPGIAVVSYASTNIQSLPVGNQDVEFYVEFKNCI